LYSRHRAGACPFRHPRESPPPQGRLFRSGPVVMTNTGARALGGGRCVSLPPSTFLPIFAPPPRVPLSTLRRESKERERETFITELGEGRKRGEKAKTKQITKKKKKKKKQMERKKPSRLWLVRPPGSSSGWSRGAGPRSSLVLCPVRWAKHT